MGNAVADDYSRVTRSIDGSEVPQVLVTENKQIVVYNEPFEKLFGLSGSRPLLYITDLLPRVQDHLGRTSYEVLTSIDKTKPFSMDLLLHGFSAIDTKKTLYCHVEGTRYLLNYPKKLEASSDGIMDDAEPPDTGGSVAASGSAETFYLLAFTKAEPYESGKGRMSGQDNEMEILYKKISELKQQVKESEETLYKTNKILEATYQMVFIMNFEERKVLNANIYVTSAYVKVLAKDFSLEIPVMDFQIFQESKQDLIYRVEYKGQTHNLLFPSDFTRTRFLVNLERAKAELRRTSIRTESVEDDKSTKFRRRTFRAECLFARTGEVQPATLIVNRRFLSLRIGDREASRVRRKNELSVRRSKGNGRLCMLIIRSRKYYLLFSSEGDRTEFLGSLKETSFVSPLASRGRTQTIFEFFAEEDDELLSVNVYKDSSKIPVELVVYKTKISLNGEEFDFKSIKIQNLSKPKNSLRIEFKDRKPDRSDIVLRFLKRDDKNLFWNKVQGIRLQKMDVRRRDFIEQKSALRNKLGRSLTELLLSSDDAEGQTVFGVRITRNRKAKRAKIEILVDRIKVIEFKGEEKQQEMVTIERELSKVRVSLHDRIYRFVRIKSVASDPQPFELYLYFDTFTGRSLLAKNYFEYNDLKWVKKFRATVASTSLKKIIKAGNTVNIQVNEDNLEVKELKKHRSIKISFSKIRSIKDYRSHPTMVRVRMTHSGKAREILFRFTVANSAGLFYVVTQNHIIEMVESKVSRE